MRTIRRVAAPPGKHHAALKGNMGSIMCTGISMEESKVVVNPGGKRRQREREGKRKNLVKGRMTQRKEKHSMA
jgi:hypothetical protein